MLKCRDMLMGEVWGKALAFYSKTYILSDYVVKHQAINLPVLRHRTKGWVCRLCWRSTGVWYLACLRAQPRGGGKAAAGSSDKRHPGLHAASWAVCSVFCFQKLSLLLSIGVELGGAWMRRLPIGKQSKIGGVGEKENLQYLKGFFS